MTISKQSTSAGVDDVSSKRAILVLGMHRSGTSALTRTLNLLGADLGDGLAPANEHNQTGYWESQRLMELHDELLVAAGSFWYDWTELDARQLRLASTDERVREFRLELQQTFGDASLFAIKDPRVCRFVPFWVDRLAEFGTRPLCILPLRNPYEVAASLQSRDGIPLATSCLLWLRHVLDAERDSRNMARSITAFDGLLDDWRGLVARIEADLSISFPNNNAQTQAEIDSLLKPGHRHHRQDGQVTGVDAAIIGWVDETYAVLREMEAGADNDAAVARLDTVRHDLDRRSALFGPVARAESYRHYIQEQRAREELERLRADNRRLTAGPATQQSVVELAQRLNSVQTSAAWSLAAPLFRFESGHQGLVRKIALPPRVLGWLLTGKFAARWQAYQDSKLIAAANLFDAQAYILAHLDAATSTVPPLLHWMTIGWQAGYDPHWLFSTDWYLQQIPQPLPTGSNPLLHYLTTPEGATLDPSPFFDSKWYLQQHPEVAASGLTPLVHYLREGAGRGWSPCPMFDSPWYLERYPDVAATGVDPLQHYIQLGHAEGRDPHPEFFTNRYRDTHPGLKETGENPLQHYLNAAR